MNIKRLLIFLVSISIASCGMEPQPALAIGNWYSDANAKNFKEMNAKACNLPLMAYGSSINTKDILGISIVKTTVTLTLKDKVYSIIFKTQQQAFGWAQEVLDGRKCVNEG